MKYLFVVFLSLTFCFGEIKTFDDVKIFINDSIEKGYFPKTIISTSGPKTRLKDINLDFRTIFIWDIDSCCDQHANEVIIVNKKENHSIMCPGNDNIYILNDGNNTVDVPWEMIFLLWEKVMMLLKKVMTIIFLFLKKDGEMTN